MESTTSLRITLITVSKANLYSAGILLLVSGAFASAPLFPVASGGDASVNNATRNAFSLPSGNMPLRDRLDFSVGNSFFRNAWVIAPASTDARDGLGGLYNTNACQNCHIKDGRGHPPERDGDNAVSMLVRLSVPPGADDTDRVRFDGNVGDPVYGGQLQDFAVPGVTPEGQVRISYTEHEVALNGEPAFTLRRPTLHIDDLGYGPLHDAVMTSVRVAPPMIGLGLLAAIPEATLQALADPDDEDGDGISGRRNVVWDVQTQQAATGRFGWKAGQPTLEQQNAAAFNGDMGITTHLFPIANCTSAQQACLQQTSGGDPEVSEEILRQVTFYSRNLAVPTRRDSGNPMVERGMEVFAANGCAGCHVADITTGHAADEWLSNQQIAPYTDLLLHDMGDGLADHRPEFEASGSEWRTPPLWGIGLTETVGGRAYYLHDGRARTLLEAILWHGGEAQASRDSVAALSPADRNALLQFLASL
ncbi:MAG: di-heme oxidoredictase family protein [Woeseia sp.]